MADVVAVLHMKMVATEVLQNIHFVLSSYQCATIQLTHLVYMNTNCCYYRIFDDWILNTN